ncbi:retinol dehydrogenase 7-like [Tubulanus polymorphus]|uniref:retinol dehydrogenase 7-like n=1 Tax=Tubulanus polymorphus TaxID=672921 RepID=UPI003DA3E25C
MKELFGTVVLITGVLYVWPGILTFITSLIVLFGVSFYYRRLPNGDLISGDSGKEAVLVTGCDSGFGNALARRLTRNGFKVFAACMFPDADGASNLKIEHPDVEILKLDVTDGDDVTRAVEYVKGFVEGKGLWALVNNAGVAQCAESEWCPISLYQQTLDVNALGVVRMTKAFLPLIRQRKGRIVNVASLAGRFAIPGFSAYCMSKTACIAFSDSLRREMKSFGVKVVTIEPGFYKTPMVQVQRQIDRNVEFWASAADECKRAYGDAYFNSYLDLIRKLLDTLCSANVCEVIDCIEEAVRRSEPRFHYVPNWKIELKFAILNILPTFVCDLIASLRRPSSMPAATVKN